MARPRGWRLNRSALDDRLEELNISRTELAARAEISVQLLGDLYGTKRCGASRKTAAALADAARCRVGTLFPESDGFGPLGESEAA